MEEEAEAVMAKMNEGQKTEAVKVDPEQMAAGIMQGKEGRQSKEKFRKKRNRFHRHSDERAQSQPAVTLHKTI